MIDEGRGTMVEGRGTMVEGRGTMEEGKWEILYILYCFV